MAARKAGRAASEPLSAEDLAILRQESATVAGHTLKIATLGPAPDGRMPDLEALRSRIAARIERAPRLRRRLDMRSRRRAAWADDPTFDVAAHVRAVPVSGTVSDDELQRICARLMEDRLDRSRPLWSMDLVTPLEGGHAALIWRLHHSLADGTVAMLMAEQVLWDASEPAPSEGGAGRQGRLAGLRATVRARRPARLPGTLRRELATTHGGSLLEGVVGAARTVAFASVGLTELRRSAKTLVPEATVNDAVLALVGAALRQWATARGAPLASPRVRVPVSLHHRADKPGTANRDSFFCVALPLAEPDPVQRLRRITEQAELCKRAGDPLVLDALARDVGRAAAPLRPLLDRFMLNPHGFALNVSNVVGPRERPSVHGAPVRAFHSIADVDQRHGLRVAVVSMAGTLHFGLCADPAIVGDLAPLTDGLLSEAAALADAAHLAHR